MEAKEVLDYLGFSDVDSLDAFKEKFPTAFIKRDVETIKGDETFYNNIVGSIANGTKTALKRALKKHDIGFDEKEFEGQRVQAVVENFVDKIATDYSSQIKALKEDSGKGADERVKDLEKQIEESKKAIEALTGEKNTISGEFDTYKTTVQTQIKTDKLNSAQEKLWGSYKWANGVNDLMKAGFKATVGQKYKADLDDDGNIVFLNLKGEKIKNPNKADAYLTPDEILIQEGTAASVYALNPHGGGKHTPPPKDKKNEPAGGQPADVRRQVNRVGRAA